MSHRDLVLGSFFAGVAGGLFAHYLSYLNPNTFTFLKSIEVIAMVVLGGMGSQIGVALAAAASAFSLVALASCSAAPGTATTAGAESGEVNIIAYAGVWQEQYEAAVLTPFKAKYPKIKINYVSKRSSAEMLSTLQGQKAAPATDVSIMDISVSESGNTQGLFDKVDAAKVANLANVDKQFLNKDGYGPAVMVDAIGLIYDSTLGGSGDDNASVRKFNGSCWR